MAKLKRAVEKALGCTAPTRDVVAMYLLSPEEMRPPRFRLEAGSICTGYRWPMQTFRPTDNCWPAEVPMSQAATSTVLLEHHL